MQFKRIIGLTLIILAFSAICSATPQQLTSLGIPIDGKQSNNNSSVFSTTLIDVFGDNRPVRAEFVNWAGNEKLTYVNFFKENKNIASLKLNTSADYIFYKARLRDDAHEELLGIGFIPHPGRPGKYTAAEILIIGLNEQRQIVRFPIAIYDRPKQDIIGDAHWDKYSKFVMSKNVAIDGKTLLLRNDLAERRPPIKIYWSWGYKKFVIDDTFGLYD